MILHLSWNLFYIITHHPGKKNPTPKNDDEKCWVYWVLWAHTGVLHWIPHSKISFKIPFLSNLSPNPLAQAATSTLPPSTHFFLSLPSSINSLNKTKATQKNPQQNKTRSICYFLGAPHSYSHCSQRSWGLKQLKDLQEVPSELQGMTDFLL